MHARTAADRVPAGTAVEDLPGDCGVSDATAARLVPGSDRDAEGSGPGDCRWSSRDDGKVTCIICENSPPSRRVLDVAITRVPGGDQSPISEAMRLMDRNQDTEGAEPPEIVEGLGDEATARYSAEAATQGAVVTFRVRNAVATISYRGWDVVRGKQGTIPEKTAMDGALTAAAETAKSMGTAARPVLTSVKHPATPPLKHVPKPCDAVPVATLDKVARDASRQRGAPTLPMVGRLGTFSDTCRWEARTSVELGRGQARTLTVSFAVADERLPGLGVFTATRLYRRIYDTLRGGELAGSGAFKGFTPLAGPGDQAFAVTKAGSGPSEWDVGLVVFRKRNLLVEVAYGGADEETPLHGSRLIDSAYTVAVAVERSLRS